MADITTTTYTQPKNPRIIKKHKGSDYQNTDSNWFRITCLFGSISGYCVWEIVNKVLPINTQIGLGLVSVASGVLWWKYCGVDPRKADRSWIKFGYFIDEKRGMHLMNKLTTSAYTLGKAFPFRKIHYNGLVECSGKEYIIMVELTPKRVTDEERETHKALVKGIVDGLHDNHIFKMFACSKQNPRKSIVDHIMNIANKAGKKERAEHLTGLLNKVLNDNTPVMMYRHYAMIGLGRHETVESAEIARGALLDGVLINMKRAHMHPKVITSKKQIINVYRESVSERVVL
jgi:hypothetical protein